MKPFTIINGGANGVNLEAERFARDFGLPVQIFIPPCHPRSKYLPPLTHQQLGEATPITNQGSNRLNKPLSNPISLQYIHQNYHVVKQAEMVLALQAFNLKVTYALEVPVGQWKWPNVLTKSSTCMMYNVTFGSGTDTMKIYSTPVIRCLKNSLLYPPFYPKRPLWGSETFNIFQTLY